MAVIMAAIRSYYLKSFSTSFPILALLKSGSDGLLRTLPSSPSSTNPQTAHSVNSQTEKRTGSRKKTATAGLRRRFAARVPWRD